MITLVWQTNRELSWETDWIEFLFNNIDHVTITDYDFKTEIDQSIFIYNKYSFNYHYFESLYKKGIKFGLIHLSDEWGQDTIDHYKFAKFVLRNYYKDLGPNVLNFPLGWMQTFPQNLNSKTVQERNLVWSFSGHVDKTTRPLMAENMLKITGGQGFFKKCGEIWGPFQGHALNPNQLADLYNNSIFVPCPQGNCSIDSLRVCEALQVGAIPIVEKSEYWSKLYGDDNPLIKISSWDESPTLIKDLLDDLDLLENKRKNIYEWWKNHCGKVKLDIQKLIEKYYDN
jgi:hypothetical protein